jgi:hypothetical protein
MAYFDLGVTLGHPRMTQEGQNPKKMTFWYISIVPSINAHYFYANAQSVNKRETNQQTNPQTDQLGKI